MPGNLKTKKQLAELGLRPAREQKPVAKKTGGYGPYALYDMTEAVPKRKPTQAQLDALEKARTAPRGCEKCSRCGAYNDYNGDGLCDDCRLQKRTLKHREDRESVTAWARNLLAQGDFVVIDTETTGLDWIDQIIEIAIIDLAGHPLLDTLVQPTGRISEGAIEVHGISPEQVATAPTMADLATQVVALLENTGTVLIYNDDFDIKMLTRSFAAHGLALPPSICTKAQCMMQQYARWFGEWRSLYSDEYRWQSLPAGNHQALGDAQASLKLLQQMAV